MRLNPWIVNRLKRFFTGDFFEDQRGTIAILFGFLVIPVILAAGIAVDYANYVRLKDQAQSAVDAAALAAVKSVGTQADRSFLANKYFEANMGVLMQGYGTTLKISDQTDSLTLTADLDSPNYLMQLGGIKTSHIQVSATALKKPTTIEVALIFDTTGSMSFNNRLVELQKAAKSFVSLLFDGKATSPNVRIALVPFAAAVNVGPDKGASFGIDVTGLSSVNNYNFIDPIINGKKDHWYNMRAWKTITNTTWNGCVEARAGALSVNDTPPSTTAPETLFVPYFSPDEPDTSSPRYYNSWRKDTVTGTNYDVIQRTVSKYTTSALNLSSGTGPYYGCRTSPIVPLTNQKSILDAGIDAFVADGATVIAEGVMWGYRVLSPGAPYTQGVDFKKAGYKKIAIVLTDGTNNILNQYGNELANHNKSYYSSYGYVAQGRLGTTVGSTFNSVLDQKTLEACTLLKSQGVTVYTMTYEVTSPTSIKLLTDCASDPAKALSVTPSTIEDYFSGLASEIRGLYLSQ